MIIQWSRRHGLYDEALIMARYSLFTRLHWNRKLAASINSQPHCATLFFAFSFPCIRTCHLIHWLPYGLLHRLPHRLLWIACRVRGQRWACCVSLFCWAMQSLHCKLNDPEQLDKRYAEHRSVSQFDSGHQLQNAKFWGTMKNLSEQVFEL